MMSVRKSLAGSAPRPPSPGPPCVLTAGPASAAYHPTPTTRRSPRSPPTCRRRLRHHPARAQAGRRRLERRLLATPSRSRPTPPPRAAAPSAAVPRSRSPAATSAGRTARAPARPAVRHRATSPDVDFARSSVAPSAAETDAGLKAFPFALDTVVMAVSNIEAVARTGRRSPSRRSGRHLRVQAPTNWSSFGGTAGASSRRSRRAARAPRSSSRSSSTPPRAAP